MGARASAAILGVAITAFGCGGNDPVPRDAGAAAATPEERLRDESRAPADVRVVRGHVRSVRGSYPSTPGATPEDAARELIGRHGEVFGTTDAVSELLVRDVRGEPGGARVVVLDRVHRGMPVFGAEIRVAVEPDGTITYVGARVPRAISVAETPAVDAAGAASSLVTALAGASVAVGAPEPAELGVYDQETLLDSPGRTVLAWRVVVSVSGGEGQRLGGFVDAMDGTLLHAFDVSRSARDRRVAECAPGFTDHDTCAATQNRPLYVEAGAVTPMPAPADAPLFARAQRMHDWAGRTYDYLSGTLGRDGWDGNGGALRFYLGIREANAFWEPGLDAMFFHPSYESLDIVAHEIGHGIQQDEARLAAWGEPGAIGESLSDVLAAFVDGDWQMLRADGSVQRDLAQGLTDRIATHYPEDFRAPPAGACEPGFYETCLMQSHDRGWVHRNSALPSLAVYLMATGGPNPARPSSTAVPALGRVKAEQIVYRAMRDYLLATSTFDDLRYQMLRACMDLRGRHGIVEQDCGGVLDAFAAVGIGPWDHDHDTWGDDCVGITAPGCVVVDNCPRVSNADQLDTDRDGVGDACEGVPMDAGVSIDAAVPPPDAGPCAYPRITCPPTFTTGGVERTLSPSGSRFFCPAYNPAASDAYHASCFYSDTPGSLTGVSFGLHWFATRENATRCEDVDVPGLLVPASREWYSATSRAWADHYPNPGETVGLEHTTVARGLLAQVGAWAEPCGELFTCPAGLTDDVGTWTLTAVHSTRVAVEAGGPPPQSFHHVQIGCAYDRAGGTVGELRLSCKWGDAPEHFHLGAPAWCLPPNLVEARSEVRRAVCWTTAAAGPGRFAALQAMLPEAERRALACP